MKLLTSFDGAGKPIKGAGVGVGTVGDRCRDCSETWVAGFIILCACLPR